MAKKQKHLLEESTTRRFMGLAGIGALSDGFARDKYKGKPANKFVKALRETAKEDLEEEKDDLEEVITDDDLNGRQTEKGARLSEMPGDDEYGGDMGNDMPPEDDMPLDEPEGGMGGDVDVEGLVTALADVIEDHTGVPVDVEGSADNGGDEMPADLGGDDMGGEYGGEDEMMEASEALARAGYALDEKSGKYYKHKDKGMYEGDDDQEKLDEGKEEDVKEDKKVQKEGDEEEELDEEAQTLKSTKPGNPGKVKTGSTERVPGAQKPGPVEHNHADHALKGAPAPQLKTLEEVKKYVAGMERRVMAKVLIGLKEELKTRKGKTAKPARTNRKKK